MFLLADTLLTTTLFCTDLLFTPCFVGQAKTMGENLNHNEQVNLLPACGRICAFANNQFAIDHALGDFRRGLVLRPRCLKDVVDGQNPSPIHTVSSIPAGANPEYESMGASILSAPILVALKDNQQAVTFMEVCVPQTKTHPCELRHPRKRFVKITPL